MAVSITTSATDGSVKILTGTKQEVLDQCVKDRLHPLSLVWNTTNYDLLATNLKR